MNIKNKSTTLTSKQRSYLRARANQLPTIAQIGKNGISTNCIQMLSAALEAHELIKIHILQNVAEDIHSLVQNLEATLQCSCVAIIGKKALLYRLSQRKNIEHIL